MKRYSIGLCLLLSTVVSTVPGFASPQTPGTPEFSKTIKTLPTAEDWYNSSVDLLKKGRRFNRAAAQLRKAIGMREDVRYHIALGCALAGRAAALAQATADRIPFSFDQAKYQKWMTAWEAAQKDANSPGYGKPRPESPTLLTKDDQLPFVMTREEASSQFRALSDEALTEWETALAQAKTLQERAEMDYLRAWGRELLRVYGESANWRDLPGAKENTRLLQEATELAPKNPLYWQSLGDMHMDLSASLDHAKDKPGALSAYRQSLKLKKTNANLWYRIYDLCKLDNPEQAEEAMRRAAQADSENAYPAYRLAGLLFLKTPYGDFSREITRIARAPFKPGEDTLPTLGKKIVDATDYDQKRQEAEKALAVVDQGNRAQQYAPPVYAPPFPVLLKAAWNFREGSYYLDNTTDIRDWHTISVSIGGYMRVMALQGDKEAAVSAARTLIAMGAKIAGDLADKPLPLPRDEKYRLDNGFSIAQTGYGWLVEGFKAAGDSMSAAEFDPEYQQFIARHTQYLEADKKAREHSYTGF